MSTPAVEVPPIAAVKDLVDLLARLELDPLHLHIDGARPLDARPNVRLWLRHRTDFERVVTELGPRPTERRYVQSGQREWHAERDDDRTRLLVSCVSFEHHPDWQPRPIEETP